METKIYANVSLLATPTDGKHLVNKETVERMINRKLKNPVNVVLASNFDATYDATAKTLTQDTPAVLTIDGITVAENNRILLAGQTDATQNGIYVVTTLGTASTAAVLTRADDFNTSEDIIPDCIIPVMQGDNNADTNWQLKNDDPVTLDTTPLVFGKFKGNATVNVFNGSFAGDGAATEFPITHGLNSQTPVVKIYDHATHEECGFTVEATSENVVTIKADVVLESTDVFDVTVLA